MANLNLWQRNKPTSMRSLFNDPWELFSAFENELTPAFKDQKMQAFSAPPCDISETESAYVLSFDIPGLRKEEIEIDVQGLNLTVSGERKSRQESKTGSVHRVERSFGRFQRSFVLPEGTDTDLIEAHYLDGVLELAVPKATAAQAKKVKIGDSGGDLLKGAKNH